MRVSHFLLGIMALLFIIACNKNNIEIDPNYPTIVTEISSSQANEILDKLANSPLSECMYIDTFGFPFFDIKNDTICINKNWRVNNSKEEITDRTNRALTDYAEFLNINNQHNIEIFSISTVSGIRYDQFKTLYPDSTPNAWLITTQAQKYNNIQVRGTYLQILLSPDDVIGIRGHWYDFIHIPEEENYKEDDAKKLLYNKTFKYKNTNFVPTESMIWYNSKKLILPVYHSSDQIELHVCWALYPSSWEIIVDCQTGEILQSVNISQI